MKKFFVLILVLLMCFSYSSYVYNSNNPITCLAVNENSEYIYPNGKLTKTCYELFQYWEQNGYPEYVCGVWSTNGSTKKITIGILENYYVGGNKAEDILKVNVEDDSNLTIVYQKHSKNKLLDIMEDMNVYLETKAEKYGLVSAGIYDDKNIVELSIKTAKKNDPKTLQLVSELMEKYGDALSVIYTDSEIIYSATLQGTLPNASYFTPSDTVEIQKDNLIYKIIIFIGFIFLVSVLFLYFAIYKRIKLNAFITSTGEVVKLYNKNIIKNEIKNTPLSPSEKMDNKIQSLINREE